MINPLAAYVQLAPLLFVLDRFCLELSRFKLFLVEPLRANPIRISMLERIREAMCTQQLSR